MIDQVPWESRIQSESKRRVVIAALMLLVLSATSALAVWFTSVRRERIAPQLQSYPLGSFGLSVPSRWTFNAIDDDLAVGLRTLGMFREPGTGRDLTVIEIQSRRPLLPSMALTALAERAGAVPTRLPRKMVFRSPLMTGVGSYARIVGKDGEIHTQLIAVMTLDGRRHAALRLSRPGAILPADVQLLSVIAGSIVDARYLRVASPTWVGNGVMVEPPQGMIMLQTTDEAVDDRLVLIPAGDERFCQIDLNVLDLKERPALSEEDLVQSPPQILIDLLAQPLNAADEHLVASLLLRHWRLTGQPPHQDSVTRISSGKRRGFMMPIRSTETSDLYEMLWGVSVSATRGVVIYVAADATATQAATAATQQLIATVRMMDEPSP